MYLPPAFDEKNADVLWSIVEAHPLGLLVSQANGELLANLVPFEVQLVGEKPKLLAHVARANAQWQSIDGQNALIVFQGANAFVTPRWYASKKQHGKVVPTWNYVMVQVRGIAKVIEDKAWLLWQVSRLTNNHEAKVPGQAWKVTDAPEDFIQSQLRGIVGLEIEVTSITGKLKASQNRSAPDRAGVVDGLNGMAGENHLAMADLVRRGS